MLICDWLFLVHWTC